MKRLIPIGKSRATVNRLSMVFRVAGPALLALDITITTIVVMKAAPEQRGRVAAREYTGLGFGVAGGAGGAWAGCVTLAALGSPTLAPPFVGEVAEGTLCVVGGILGGSGVGWAGREAGETAGDAIERFLPGSLPHAEWTLRLIGTNPGESVAIYPVTRPGRLGNGRRRQHGCRLRQVERVKAKFGGMRRLTTLPRGDRTGCGVFL